MLSRNDRGREKLVERARKQAALPIDRHVLYWNRMETKALDRIMSDTVRAIKHVTHVAEVKKSDFLRERRKVLTKQMRTDKDSGSELLTVIQTQLRARDPNSNMKLTPSLKYILQQQRQEKLNTDNLHFSERVRKGNHGINTHTVLPHIGEIKQDDSAQFPTVEKQSSQFPVTQLSKDNGNNHLVFNNQTVPDDNDPKPQATVDNKLDGTIDRDITTVKHDSEHRSTNALGKHKDSVLDLKDIHIQEPPTDTTEVDNCDLSLSKSLSKVVTFVEEETRKPEETSKDDAFNTHKQSQEKSLEEKRFKAMQRLLKRTPTLIRPKSLSRHPSPIKPMFLKKRKSKKLFKSQNPRHRFILPSQVSKPSDKPFDPYIFAFDKSEIHDLEERIKVEKLKQHLSRQKSVFKKAQANISVWKNKWDVERKRELAMRLTPPPESPSVSDDDS